MFYNATKFCSSELTYRQRHLSRHWYLAFLASFLAELPLWQWHYWPKFLSMKSVANFPMPWIRTELGPMTGRCMCISHHTVSSKWSWLLSSNPNWGAGDIWEWVDYINSQRHTQNLFTPPEKIMPCPREIIQGKIYSNYLKIFRLWFKSST